jgi:4-aminobutyrate aminotransferase-like enzyme
MDYNKEQLYQLDADSLLRVPNYKKPLIITKGEGLYLECFDKKKYLDFSSGWNVCNLGWSNKRLLTRLRTSDAPTYIPPWFTNEYKIKLADAYSNYLKSDYKILFGVSGSDVCDFAFKTAIKATKSRKFISFENSYHGTSIELLKCGNFSTANINFLLSTENYIHLKLPDKNRIANWALYQSEIIDVVNNAESLAGFIFEPIFTNPGMLSWDKEFYKLLQTALNKKNALLIADEIGTGFGRTGKMFAFEHFEIKPDIILLGKAITSGVIPMSCMLVKKELDIHCKGVGFYSTYGGTPLACDIALENFQILQENNLIRKSYDLGEYIKEYIRKDFQELQSFYDVRGYGLSIGIELVNKDKMVLSIDEMEAIKKECEYNSLIINFSNYTSTFIIMPPLTISKDEIIRGLEILKKSIKKIQC